MLKREDLETLKEEQRLWLHDSRSGVLVCKPAILKKWQAKYRFLIQIFDDDGAHVDDETWSVETNLPIGQGPMRINQGIWLTLRD